MVGLDGAEEITHSPRIRGLAAKLLAKKRPIRQMIPLSKQMVMTLERAVVESECLPDAIIAGQALFCVYARARWGDAQHISDLEVDGPETGDYFMQAKVWKTKTSSQTNYKSDFLPMVAMGNGLDLDWGRVWLSKRSKAGLVFSQERPALPVLLTTGSFGNIPMRTGEATRWLREIFMQNGYLHSDLVNIGSHSLKATMLSWCAKYGVEREHRQILRLPLHPRHQSLVALLQGRTGRPTT